MIRAVALLGASGDLAVVRVAAGLGETTVVTLAPPGGAVDELLASARAAGAARLVRLWDEAVESTDYLGVAFALAGTVRALVGDLTASPTAPAQPVVIVCGDGGRGAVGPAVAERLGVPHLGEVVGAQVIESRVVARRRSGTMVRMYGGAPPLVLCVAPVALARAAAPSEAAAWTSAAKDSGEAEVWTLDRIGLTSAELAYRKRFRPQPAPGPVATPLRFANARELVARLRSDGVLPGQGKSG